MSQSIILLFSLLGGIVPAMFWLWFWIREDRLKPEPKSALLWAFIGGMLAVFFALFIELIIYYLLADSTISIEKKYPASFWLTLQYFTSQYDVLSWQITFWSQAQSFFDQFTLFQDYNLNIQKIFLVVLVAPIVEEIVKFILTYAVSLRRRHNDEPIDASIYMLTGALGFAALETALFLTSPLSAGKIIDTFIAGNFRSIGAMLIHLVSSAILGIFIGLAFYKSCIKKVLYFLSGLAIAIILHSIFNLFIVLNETTKNIWFFWSATTLTWILVFVLLAFFGKIKKVKKPVKTKVEKKELNVI
jgi:RsiW-degrading membrane proteinase PrsW (M82 family)